MGMIKPVIFCTYWFPSSSNPQHLYETLLYVDRTMSCGCPGWTRRVDADGNRSCKHTRLVAAGLGNAEAARFHIHKENAKLWVEAPETKTNNHGVMMPKPGQRKLVIE